MDSSGYTLKHCDVLVIGGGSGALAALEASQEKGLKVILANKGPIGQSGLTPTAAGGADTPISTEEAFRKVVTAGNFLNDQNVLWHLVNGISDSFLKLDQMQLSYIRLTPTVVCVPGVETLKKCKETLLRKPNFELLEDLLVTRLLISGGKVCGATALDLTTGEFLVIQTSAIVIATGGFTGDLYPHTSNNPFGVSTGANGTGHILAYEAGAELIDMEMIQFVPIPANPRCLQVRYFPEFWKGPYSDRLGNVIVPDTNTFPGESYSYLFTQTLFREIEKGNGPIYIDRRGIEPPGFGKPGLAVSSWAAKRKAIESLGIDPRENKIEITLGSHFGMGGIKVNEKTETSIPGLFATGEVMGGVHGAMRMPGYSIAQIIVFGFESGRQAAIYARNEQPSNFLPDDQIETEKERLFQFLQPKDGPLTLIEFKRQLQNIMQEHVFIFRDRAGLIKAREKINVLKQALPRINIPDFRRSNLTWQRTIEFTSLIKVAEIVVESALDREESRGAHYRIDFPTKNDQTWLKHTSAKLEKGKLTKGTIPVNLDRLRPEVQA